MFRLLSDGSCDLSPEQLDATGIGIIPYYISLDGETYLKEAEELDVHDFYRFCLDHPDVYPKTSMPTVQDYIDAFEKCLSAGYDVLCYCLTSKFSGSLSCAHTAAAILAGDYPGRTIRAVDSTLATGLQGLLLLELSRYAKEGHDLEETYRRGEEIKRKSAIFFTLENLSYLSHGGRIGKLVGLAMNGMRMRPVIRFGSGELSPAGICLGMDRAFDKTVALMRQIVIKQKLTPEKYTFAIGWGCSEEEAAPLFEKLKKMFRELFGEPPEFVPIQIGATVGVHIGPHSAGCAYIEKA